MSQERASRHNAWLDAVSQAIQQNAANPPEVGAAVEAASSALIEWVKFRTRALGEAEPNDAAVRTRPVGRRSSDSEGRGSRLYRISRGVFSGQGQSRKSLIEMQADIIREAVQKTYGGIAKGQ